MNKTTLLSVSLAAISLSLQSQVTIDSMVTTLEKVIVEKKIDGYIEKNPSSPLRLVNSITQIPQNIQVINESIINSQQLFDLSENVTNNISGAGTSFRDNWGNYSNIYMRGASVTALRNGMNLRMPWGPLTEDLCMVQKIEFIKGPASFLFSNGEPSGSYNIVTKKPTGKSVQEVRFAFGSFDTYRTAIDFDGRIKKNGSLLYRLNIAGTAKNAHREFDFNKRFSFAPVLTWTVDERTNITAEYTYQHMKMAMLGSAYVFSLKPGDLPAAFSTLEPNLDPTTINDQSLLITLHHKIDKQWDLTSRAGYFRYNQQGSSIWPAAPVGLMPDGELVRSIANWDAFNESIQAQLYINGQFSIGKIRNNLLSGFDMSYKSYYADFYQSSTITGYDIYGNSVPFNIYSPTHSLVPVSALPRFDRSLPLRSRGGGTIGESSGSFYVLNEVTLINDRLRIGGGARFTNVKQHSFGAYSSDNRVTPRVGINYKVSRDTYFYLMFDQSFLPQQGVDSTQNPFVPVVANSTEAGIKKDCLDGRLNTTIAIYRVTRNNIVTVIPGPTYKAIQTSQTRTRGIELDLKGEVTSNLNVMLNYAYTEAKITKHADSDKIGDDVPAAVFPRHIMNTWIHYRCSKGKTSGLGAGVGYHLQASRPNGLPVYHRVDLAASFPLGRITFAANVYNAFDKYLYSGAPYEFNNDPASTEYYFQVEPGINFRFSVSCRF
jgi:iron complex outermembrane receptor protein